MPYTAEISRGKPACIAFLLDQSASMGDAMQDGERSKAEFLSLAINRILRNLSIRCAKGEEIRDYFDLIALGYGDGVGPAFEGDFTGQMIVSIGNLGQSPARIETRAKKVDDGAGGLVEEQVQIPIWLDPKAANGTPMCQAISALGEALASWVAEHPTSFPPIVIHFTDGEATDGDPSPHADVLRSLRTDDGNLLMFNAHISSHGGTPIVFPKDAGHLPDEFARLLFSMSSEIPGKMAEEAAQLEIAVAGGARGFIYNAGAQEIVSLLEIGTRPAALR